VSVPVGSLAVTSVPANAAIWLDNENTGKFTNTTLTGIPAGEHVITLKLDDYVDASITVMVIKGETATVHLNLEEVVVAPVAAFTTNVTGGCCPAHGCVHRHLGRCGRLVLGLRDNHNLR